MLSHIKFYIKNNKLKILGLISIFVILTIASMYVCVYIDTLFTKAQFTSMSVKETYVYVMNNELVKKMSMYVELLVIIFFIQVFTRTLNYEKLIRVTDDIYTPMPAGSIQNDSARWSNVKEFKSDLVSKTLVEINYKSKFVDKEKLLELPKVGDED